MEKYENNFKRKVIATYQNKIPIKEIMARYHISKSTIYNWLKQNKIIKHCKNTECVRYADYLKMKHERDKAIADLQIYQALHCFTDAATKEKEKAIQQFIGIYPIKTMCRLLNLPKGTFYNFHLRRKEKTQYQLRDEALKPQILTVYENSHHIFGAKKITAKLHTEGINTSIKKVQQLMRELNISSVQKKQKEKILIDIGPIYHAENKLNRNFQQPNPNTFWVSDVTELKIGRNKFYLCAIMDLFSRKIIAHRLSSQNNTSLTINTMKDAFETRHHPVNLSFHSDQGSNYTAEQFRQLLHTLKIDQSLSYRGTPYDNACMESFFATFKREEYNTKQYQLFKELEQNIDIYMNFYNDYRPHETLKGKTPNQVEQEYYTPNIATQLL